MKKLAVLSFLGILLATAVTVAVWASIADAPWEESPDTAETLGTETATATPPPPAFTEEEVLGLMSRMVGGRWGAECFAADYKPQNRMWIVYCTVNKQFGGSETETFTFDDQTGH